MSRKQKYGTELIKRRPSATNNLQFSLKMPDLGRRSCGRRNGTKINSNAYKSYVYPQARNIVEKFGTPYDLCGIVNQILPEGEKPWAPSTVYRWMYPKGVQGGTGGEIPVRKIKTILIAARYFGIVITSEDLYPKLI